MWSAVGSTPRFVRNARHSLNARYGVRSARRRFPFATQNIRFDSNRGDLSFSL